GTYDPELNLLYWGTGNPNPDYYGDGRKGDNLYTNSLVAIDAATGRLKWHYQFTPHDTHDWDSNHVPVLADLTIGGVTRKVVMVANRNGFFYALDRRDGALLVGQPFTDTAWALASRCGPTPVRAKRQNHGRCSESRGRHDLQPALVRRRARPAVPERPRDVRDLRAAAAGERAGQAEFRRRRARRSREGLRR